MNAVIPDLRYRTNHGVELLCTHDVYLRRGPVALRPMTEGDWGSLFKWNNDPEVMAYSDHDDFKPRELGELQAIYRWISTHAYCFVIEVKERPVGECWLQRMNLRRIVDQFPGRDLRRIDIAIGEKEVWGLGYGTEAIRLLVDFGFRAEAVDAIFAIVSADNPRSLRAFQKCGFEWHAVIPEEDGSSTYDMVVTPQESSR